MYQPPIGAFLKRSQHLIYLHLSGSPVCSGCLLPITVLNVGEDISPTILNIRQEDIVSSNLDTLQGASD